MRTRLIFTFILSTIGVLVFAFDDRRRKGILLFMKENKRPFILAFNLTVPFIGQPALSLVPEKDLVNVQSLKEQAQDGSSMSFLKTCDELRALEADAFNKRAAADQLKSRLLKMEERCLRLRRKLSILESRADRAEILFQESQEKFLTQENNSFSDQEGWKSNDDSDFEYFRSFDSTDSTISSPKKKKKNIYFHKKGLASYFKWLWTPKAKNPED